MSQQARLDVFGPKRLAKKGIAQQIDLPNRKIIRSLPVSVNQIQFSVRQRLKWRFLHAELPRQREAMDAGMLAR
jgi:hypothetical protein